MDEREFHLRIKEILASIRRGPDDASAKEIHEAFSNEVKGRSGKDWDDTVAIQVIREFERVTRTQPKREDLSEAAIKDVLGTFLSERGYRAVPIPESSKKTPDFYLEKSGNGRRYICEIKSPELNFDHTTGTYKHKTSHRKLLGLIRKAIEQFKEHDPDHRFPWVLAFTSTHFQMNWSNFTDTIQGGIIDRQGNRMPDFSKTPAYTNAQSLFPEIDAYCWFQVNARGRIFNQASYFLNKNSLYLDEVVQLLKDLSSMKISEMDNTFTLDFE